MRPTRVDALGVALQDPTMPSPRRPRDLNQLAHAITAAATGEAEDEEPAVESEPEKNPAAVALGKLGGAKGGKARAESLTPARRRAIAKKAAKARWKTGS